MSDGRKWHLLVLGKNLSQQWLKKVATTEHGCNSSHRGDMAKTDEDGAASIQQSICLSQEAITQLSA